MCNRLSIFGVYILITDLVMKRITITQNPLTFLFLFLFFVLMDTFSLNFLSCFSHWWVFPSFDFSAFLFNSSSMFGSFVLDWSTAFRRSSADLCPSNFKTFSFIPGWRKTRYFNWYYWNILHICGTVSMSQDFFPNWSLSVNSPSFLDSSMLSSLSVSVTLPGPRNIWFQFLTNFHWWPTCWCSTLKWNCCISLPKIPQLENELLLSSFQ